jgi:periplasmic divalent cation tolerance protein
VSVEAGTDVRLVVVTAPSLDVARRIATTVVEESLAACVNIVPEVRSIFRWEGRLEDEAEVLLLIKTRSDRLRALETRVRTLHPYSVPEFIAVTVASGHEPYLDWVASSTKVKGGGGPDQE